MKRCPLLLAALAILAAASPAPAQSRGSGIDLNLLALEWARGVYGAPVLCEVGGQPVRAVRRVLVAPAPADGRGPLDRIQFPDPEAEGATRCFSELGADEPLVSGFVDISLPGHSRPDTARLDFGAALKRDRGFTFDVRSGRLRVRGWKPGEDWREVDFGGGEATIRTVADGTDAARLLRDFESPRRLTIGLTAPDGTALEFHVFQHDRR